MMVCVPTSLSQELGAAPGASRRGAGSRGNRGGRLPERQARDGDALQHGFAGATVKPVTQLVDAAPEGDQWLHEIKDDGYRIHARLDRDAVKLLTRTGLDWTHKYPPMAKTVAALDARQAYLDGELCGIGPDGIPSFNIVQLASDRGNAASLVFFLFDLLHLDGEDLRPLELIERKERLSALLADAGPCLRYNDHVIGRGPAFYEKACAQPIEGIVSKRIDARPTNPAIAGCGARQNAYSGRSLSSSAGASRKEGGLISVPCCSPTTIRTEGSSMPALPAAASMTRSSNGCGDACSRSRRARCRPMCRRRAIAASGLLWF
jgi:hypothetical protein